MIEQEFKRQLAAKDEQIRAALEATTATVLEVDKLKGELQVVAGRIVSLEQLVQRLSQQASSLTDHGESRGQQPS